MTMSEDVTTYPATVFTEHLSVPCRHQLALGCVPFHGTDILGRRQTINTMQIAKNILSDEDKYYKENTELCDSGGE